MKQILLIEQGDFARLRAGEMLDVTLNSGQVVSFAFEQKNGVTTPQKQKGPGPRTGSQNPIVLKDKKITASAFEILKTLKGTALNRGTVAKVAGVSTSMANYHLANLKKLKFVEKKGRVFKLAKSIAELV